MTSEQAREIVREDRQRREAELQQQQPIVGEVLRAPRRGMIADANGVREDSTGGEVSASDAVGRPRSGILSTATNEFGSPLASHTVKADSMVRVHGIPMTADQAVAHGFLEVDSRGRYVECGQASVEDRAAPQKAKETQERVQEPATDPTEPPALSTDMQNFRGFIDQNIPPEITAQAVNDLVSGEGISLRAVHEAANAYGIDPEVMKDRIAEYRDALAAQADASLKIAGIVEGGAEMVWEWARAEAPSELAAAIRHHYTRGDTSAYQLLARKFLKFVSDGQAARPQVAI